MDSISTFVTSSPRSQREVLAAALLEKRRRRWRVQPSAFVRDVLQEEPTDYSKDEMKRSILDMPYDPRRV